MRRHTCHIVIVFAVLVGSVLPLLAAPTPEETARYTAAPATALALLLRFAQDVPTSTSTPDLLYYTGDCYCAKQQAAEAVTTLDNALTKYKLFNNRARAAVLLFKVSLQAQLPDKATRAYGIIAQEYPVPTMLYEMLEAEYLALQAAGEPALAPYTKWRTFAALPAEWGLRERLLWFRVLAATDEKLLIQEAQAAAPGWVENSALQDLALMLAVGGLIYEPMMRSKQATEARAYSDQLQDLLAAKGNPFKMADADNKMYFEKLAKFSPKDFATQGKPLIKTLKWATSVAEAQALQPFIAQYYMISLREASIEDARAMHAFVQKTLGQLGYTDLVEKDTQAFKAGYSLTTIAALCARAKVLIARDKEAEATRLVTELKEIAPEAPEVRKLVEIYEEFLAERKK